MSMLNDEQLSSVNGGLKPPTQAPSKEDLAQKKVEFQNAWTVCRMDEKGLTPHARDAWFDEWQNAGFKPSAVDFISARAK